MRFSALALTTTSLALTAWLASNPAAAVPAGTSNRDQARLERDQSGARLSSLSYDPKRPDGTVLIIGGGGPDVDRAYQIGVNMQRGCDTNSCARKSDLTVVRATGGNGYDEALMALTGVNSAQTLVLSSRKDAGKRKAEDRLRKSDWIFYAGGNQCDYVTYYKGTPVDDATKYAARRGATIGGTSAGSAIMGEYVFDACSEGGTTSKQALENPYDSSITFTYDFNKYRYMERTIVDMHFKKRDRMGRLLSFMARQIQDGKTSSVWGIAVNEATAIVVDKKGMGTVVDNDGKFGTQPKSEDPVAYAVYLDQAPEECREGRSLTASGFKVWKLLPGDTFNFKNRPASGHSYTLDVDRGVIKSSGDGVY